MHNSSPKEIQSQKTWDDYFIDIMHATSARSKDPNTKVGAVIVDQDNKIVGMGYNGFPPGVKDYEERWDGKETDGSKTKYKYVVHAEMNAIFNSFKPVSGCRVYIPFWPCSDCAKHMAAAGISEIIIEDTEYYDRPLTRQILIEAGITVRDVKKNYIISKDATWCMNCGVTRAAVTNSLGQSQCRKCGGY